MASASKRSMSIRMLVPVLVILTSYIGTVISEIPPPCSSDIYCKGPLLETIQLANIYPDSKTFVDRKQTQSTNVTLTDFDNLMIKTKNKPTRAQIESFVTSHFAAGDELALWIPPDYNPSPSFLNEIQDNALKQFARDLVSIWPNLGRKANEDVAKNPELYSFVYIPNGFIIPGGRFTEQYYWDTYWIIQGLLVSEMSETVKGILENFLDMIKRFGHVLNGSRVYYTQRSQPPLLTAMVKKYIDYTSDWPWLKENIAVIDKELQFWFDNRQVGIVMGRKKYQLFRYNAPSEGPRPESYLEDYTSALSIAKDDKQRFYTDIKSAAESGWDFSSRWFVNEQGCANGCNLSDIHTTDIVPVDLNAIIANGCKIISEMYFKLGDKVNGKKWQERSTALVDAIEKVLWNECDGIWYDYDLKHHKPRRQFFPSNVFPLWLQTIPETHKIIVYAKPVVKFLETSGALDYNGGIPTSFMKTGQQWDLPNAWPPLQAIIIEGLANSGYNEAIARAAELAQKWVTANHIGFVKEREMFEKYDANNLGGYGGGGEYVIQAGFGWTNGVALQLIKDYARVLTAEN